LQTLSKEQNRNLVKNF